MSHPHATRVETTPYWSDTASLPPFPRVEKDERVDVIVVGGGITGLTAACLLAAAGRSVAVLERARCAEIDSGHTSAHLTMVTDARLTDLAGRFGRTHAQAAWDAGLAAIAQIDGMVREYGIDCDFEWVDGYLHAPIGQSDGTEREREIVALQKDAALATELGFDASFVNDIPWVGGPGVRFDHQARFHPRKYLAGLAQAVTARGGRIYEHSEAAEFSEQPRGVKVNGWQLTCDDIVVATHNPVVGIASAAGAAIFQTKLALYTSYVIAGRVQKG